MQPNHALRQARIQRHWTQSTLAIQLNTTRLTVHRWEQGKALPNFHFRQLLCQLFEATPEELGLVQEPVLSDPPLLWRIPFPRNLFFTGREPELHQLHKSLRAEKPAAFARIQVLSGLGGMGKTQLALEYAYRFRADYALVLWVQADSREMLMAEMAELAHFLHLPENRGHDHRWAAHALKQWLDRQQNWLLIFDNVEDFSLIYELLPVDFVGSVLVTTRHHATYLLGPRLDLPAMTREEGATLLLRRAKLLVVEKELESVPAQQQVDAFELCQALDSLPLALDQAGAYIEEFQCSLRDYLQRLRQNSSLLLTWRGKSRYVYPYSMSRTVSLAFAGVEQRSTDAADLLRFCVFLHPDAISRAFLSRSAPYLAPPLQHALLDALSLDRAISIISATSLFRVHPETQQLMIHRLVQTILRDQMPAHEQRLWMEQALNVLQAIFPSDPHYNLEAWPLCEQLLPHVLYCTAYAQHLTWKDEQNQVLSTWSTVLFKATDYLLERARYQEATFLLEQIRARYQQEGRYEHPDMIFAHLRLAKLAEKQGRYREAEHFLEEALARHRQIYGESHPRAVMLLNTQALLYGRQGEYALATEVAHQALRLGQQTHDGEGLAGAETLHILALLAIWMGKYAEAGPYAQRALRLLEMRLEPEHPDVADVVNTLAIVYLKQQNYAKASLLYQRALQIWERVLGPEHPMVGYPLNNLALVAMEQAKYREAELLLERALHLWEKTLGAEHPDVAHLLKNRGELNLLRQKHTEVASPVQRALRIWEQTLGFEHPLLAPPLTTLATLLALQGQEQEAEVLYQRALTLCQRLHAGHPQVVLVLSGLAKLYCKQGRYRQALPLIMQALAIHEQIGEVQQRGTQEIGRLAFIILLALRAQSLV